MPNTPPNAVLSRHTTLLIKAIGDEDFVAVGRLTNIPVPDPESEEIDISALDSEGSAKEFIRGAIDNGSLEVSGQYKADEAGQKKLYDLYKTGENFLYQILAPSGIVGIAIPAKYEGMAYVSKCKPFGDASEGETLPFNCTLRLTGEPNYYAAILDGTKLPTPVATPDGGNFETSINVTLSCDISDAVIHYTIDGLTTPTAESPVYSTAINLTETTTIKAIAVKDGLAASDVMSKTFTKTE